MTERPHGYARYRLDGCRCYACAFARSQYDDNRNRAIAYGTWQPWTDAAPVRAHIQTLQSCEMGLRTIAAAAGCDRKRLQAIITGRPERGTGPQDKVRPALAAAVLAVEPTLGNLAPSVPISGLGTRRRLQALIAHGFPQDLLCSQLGLASDNLALLLNGRQEQVLVRKALAVRDLYERLWRADPAEYGAQAHGISAARHRAARNRWAPPGAWDDERLDDPDGFPNWTGHCGTPDGPRAHRRSGVPLCEPCRAARAAAREGSAA